jgi:hypothetical protein
MLDTIFLFHNHDTTVSTNPYIYIYIYIRIDPMVNLLYALFHDYFHLDYYKYVCFYYIIVHL